MKQSLCTRSRALLVAILFIAGGRGAAQTLSPTSLTFANTSVGTSRGPIGLTFTNGATGPLTINSISVSGSFSETTNCPLAPKTLAINGSCKIAITFTPTTLGLQTGVLTVSDSDASSPQTAQLAGTGVAPVTLSPTNLTFGNQFVNATAASKTVTLTNNQIIPLSISGISAPNNFAATSSCPLAPNTLAARSSCSIQVTFTPTKVGPLSGTLIVNDNAPNTPQTVA